jgi:hypothetical protein
VTAPAGFAPVLSAVASTVVGTRGACHRGEPVNKTANTGSWRKCTRGLALTQKCVLFATNFEAVSHHAYCPP